MFTVPQPGRENEARLLQNKLFWVLFIGDHVTYIQTHHLGIRLSRMCIAVLFSFRNWQLSVASETCELRPFRLLSPTMDYWD